MVARGTVGGANVRRVGVPRDPRVYSGAERAVRAERPRDEGEARLVRPAAIPESSPPTPHPA
eukprot:scaffold115486_cov19-Tisochrysis_lutea.AAC.1